MVAKKTTRRKDVWEIMSLRLHDLGWPARPAKLIKSKVNDLKKNYKLLVDEVGPSGAGSEILRKFPFFYSVHEILRDRPAMVAPVGSIGESEPLTDDDDDVSTAASAGKLPSIS